jgi:TPR repeat protein
MLNVSHSILDKRKIMSISNNNQAPQCIQTTSFNSFGIPNAARMHSKEKTKGYKAEYGFIFEEVLKIMQRGYISRETYLGTRDKLLYLVGKKYAPAEHVLGVVYLTVQTEQSKNKGVFWIERAANRGHAIAQSDLGTIYLLGKVKSRKHALMWYQRSAAQECCDGQYNLGIFYLQPDEIERDYVKAAALLKSAALQGHLDAQFQLGVMYEYGLGLQIDRKASVYWMEQAADAGYLTAQLELIKRAAYSHTNEFDTELVPNHKSIH